MTWLAVLNMTALDTRLDTVEARPYLDVTDGTPTVVSQGA